MEQDASRKNAIIIGAGPAGLTAAYELVTRTDVQPIVLERGGQVGGLAKTLNYKGNRIDIGGHRFFSKSDRVMQWWQKILPLQGAPARDEIMLSVAYQGSKRPVKLSPGGPDPEKSDQVMLIRSRLSRIFFRRKLFNYPLSLSWNTIKNLGVMRTFLMGCSYAKSAIAPIRQEKSLEDFFINRFGRNLYTTFFKDYTEKVWGVPCKTIRPEWGAQRIKGLSIGKALRHAVKNIFSRDSSLGQKETETSLIEKFLYPKFGPGQMWEEVTRIIVPKGCKILFHHEVLVLRTRGNRIVALEARDTATGETEIFEGDYFFSTMPVKDLISAMGPAVPAEVQKVAQGLCYRDFLTVGLLLNKLKIKNETRIKTYNDLIPDNWIYIQENYVHIGRLQIFNNWSPYMVSDPNKVWLGLEYFCDEGDEIWSKPDDALAEFAAGELASLGFIESGDVLDHVVLREIKTYPAYFGTYDQFETIRGFVDGFENLFLVGRNGMHRYNNQDHSMLTAMTAVENIINGITAKDNIWSVNIEMEYHEEKASEES